MPKGERKLPKNMELTEKQKKLIYGVLLSDGWLELGKKNVNARIGLQLNYKSKEYIEYFKEQLANYINTKIYPKELNRKSNLTGKVYKQLSIKTYTSPVFTELIPLFGGYGKNKTIPKYSDLMKLLDWEVLAHIIMCDGSRKSSRSGQAIKINFQSYSKKALDRFCLAIYHKLGVRCWPGYYGMSQDNKTRQFSITISGFEQPKLNQKLKPYMAECFLYKIPPKSKRNFSIGNYEQNKSFYQFIKAMKTSTDLEQFN